MRAWAFAVYANEFAFSYFVLAKTQRGFRYDPTVYLGKFRKFNVSIFDAIHFYLMSVSWVLNIVK